MTTPTSISILTTKGFSGYRLLDSGAGRKLEQFGGIVLDRPEPQAIWRPARPPDVWARAHAVFSASGDDEEKGRWRIDRPVPENWPVAVEVETDRGLVAATMMCRLQGLWHVGLFPEQLPHWAWMCARLSAVEGERPRVLNLFGYTGAASLLAAAAGAEVTHVDASRKAIQWGKDNQQASRLGDRPIRWLLDDASRFVAREVRRGRTYQVILVDPPKFGRGPDGEIWELFTSLPPLLADCRALLAPGRSALVLTAYAIRASALAFDQLLRETLIDRGGAFETGELAIAPPDGGNQVPTSLYVRWQA